MAITEETREEDERLREELRHVDIEKLKSVLKPLVAPSKKPLPQKRKNSPKR
jgi:hypothetical protein